VKNGYAYNRFANIVEMQIESLETMLDIWIALEDHNETVQLAIFKLKEDILHFRQIMISQTS